MKEFLTGIVIVIIASTAHSFIYKRAYLAAVEKSARENFSSVSTALESDASPSARPESIQSAMLRVNRWGLFPLVPLVVSVEDLASSNLSMSAQYSLAFGASLFWGVVAYIIFLTVKSVWSRTRRKC